jgi:hypothetical protein
MALVKYLKGDMKGQVGYLDYHSYQAVLQDDPDALEIMENADVDSGDVGHSIDLAERTNDDPRNGVHNPVAPLDMSHPDYETATGYVSDGTPGHGAAGSDAQRVGPTTMHTIDNVSLPRDGDKPHGPESGSLSARGIGEADAKGHHKAARGEGRSKAAERKEERKEERKTDK